MSIQLRYELTPVETYYNQAETTFRNGMRVQIASEDYDKGNSESGGNSDMIEFDSLGSPNSLNVNPSHLSFATHFPSSKNLTHKQPWVSISYYEKTVRCGDEFNGYNPSIHVDGGCHPWDENRFCLGKINNINRDTQTGNLRCHIGKGLLLELRNNEVICTNRSKHSIFIQSQNWNVRENKDLGLVRKVESGKSAMVFCHLDFAERLQHCVNNFSNQGGYQQVAEMGNMLQVRISLIKGWSSDYKRQRITACPCWIEVKFQIGLQWLDRVISNLGSPSENGPTSNS